MNREGAKSAKESKKIFDRLPGDLRELAELIGLEDMKKIVVRWGGGYLLVPKCDEILREIRDNEIREAYDAGGVTIRDLAFKYKLHIRTVNTILSKESEDVPLPLLDLMNQK